MLYLSKPFQCSYYSRKKAQYVLFHLPEDVSSEQYNAMFNQLSSHGFRRSNNTMYRPRCANCQECISLRVDCHQFHLKRRYKRILNRNKDIQYQLLDAVSTPEQFLLFQKYQALRHKKGSMYYKTIEEYHQNLINTRANTRIMEFRCDQDLKAVAIIDVLDHGISAVYTYYDPDEEKRSLGNYAILKQIELCQNMQMRWLYLGYWLENHSKMKYKIDFQPSEIYKEDHWVEAADKPE